MCRFLTEVKKMDGTNFPGKTLYDIVVCVQFHLETLGFNWKLINKGMFHDLKFTLDNLMKERTARGIGKSVKRAQILTTSDEEYLWNVGLLGDHDPDTLLNTMVFVISKGIALRAVEEHQALCAPPFSSQLSFLHDDDGEIFLVIVIGTFCSFIIVLLY